MAGSGGRSIHSPAAVFDRSVLYDLHIYRAQTALQHIDRIHAGLDADRRLRD